MKLIALALFAAAIYGCLNVGSLGLLFGLGGGVLCTAFAVALWENR